MSHCWCLVPWEIHDWLRVQSFGPAYFCITIPFNLPHDARRKKDCGAGCWFFSPSCTRESASVESFSVFWAVGEDEPEPTEDNLSGLAGVEAPAHSYSILAPSGEML
ncbi:hypothetical protein DPEC_G00237160 [Dallia pectoralis]|uniref:Uncharacterized protein n=1 Tax=Dallia pectoralis TaxID=75939 RepID=A0ACC2FYI4_DALPE|nr:hypothetical protein DPEC_G00237160 [Dallia pectoralis]